MSELVTRLRDEALAAHQEAWSRRDGGQDLVIAAMLAEAAADEIERLTARLADAERMAEALVVIKARIDAVLPLTDAPTTEQGLSLVAASDQADTAIAAWRKGGEDA